MYQSQKSPEFTAGELFCDRLKYYNKVQISVEMAFWQTVVNFSLLPSKITVLDNHY